MRPRPLLLAVPLLFVLAGCGDDQDPEGARMLWERIHEEDYQSWQRAPGYESRVQSNAPHGDEVEIFLNPVIADVVFGTMAASEWPVGSLIVKNGYEGELSLVAVMEKRDSGWYWAEYDADADGEATYS